jgi:hypothetical protein
MAPAPEDRGLRHLTVYRLRLFLKDPPVEDHLHIVDLVPTVQGLPHGGLDADHIILALVLHRQVDLVAETGVHTAVVHQNENVVFLPEKENGHAAVRTAVAHVHQNIHRNENVVFLPEKENGHAAVGTAVAHVHQNVHRKENVVFLLEKETGVLAELTLPETNVNDPLELTTILVVAVLPLLVVPLERSVMVAPPRITLSRCHLHAGRVVRHHLLEVMSMT